MNIDLLFIIAGRMKAPWHYIAKVGRERLVAVSNGVSVDLISILRSPGRG